MAVRFVFSLILFSCASSLMGQVVINEICAANGDVIYDPRYFNFSGWIELHNKGAGQADVGGYYLSDDPTDRGKWRIPAGTTIPARGFLMIWCDGMYSGVHTNFNLDSDGETVILSNASMSETDRITFPEQHLNVSYGRTTDGGSTIGYLVQPSPGAQNNSATGMVRLENPEFSLKAGKYSGQQQISIRHGLPGVQIRYTIDGSEPTSGSALYSNAVSVSRTTTLKAKAFLENYIPSKTEVKTYFINERGFTLPVVSLSLRPEYLTDNKIGIYVDGNNGVAGNCIDRPVNWNQDWHRHASFEYFDKSGSKFLDHEVDIRIGGACSRNNPQKSFAIKARDKYGRKTIDHEFFTTKDMGSVGGLMLRNSGNDFWYTMFRDALLHTLPLGEMDIDYQAYQPSILYLNGNYWGIQNIREKIDADYIESNFGISRDDLDLIETWGNALEGTNQHYFVYIDSLQKIDLSSPEAFAFLNRYVDVQELINYLTAEIYYANTDWPGNNIKFWRQRSNGGKFRWILWDTDFGFGLYSDQSYPSHPTLHFATATNGPDWPNPPSSTLHLRLLLENPDFRNKFVQTLTTSLSTTFHPERVIRMIDSFQENLRTEMPHHATRWGISMSNWNWEVERLRAFARERNSFMQGYIAEFFGYSDQVRVSAQAFPLGSGNVTLNGITSKETVDGAVYFKGLPLEVRPAAAPGYKFTHYKIVKQENTPVPLISRGDLWRYHDGGDLMSDEWKAESFDHATWQEGEAQLGYGDGDEKTVVSFGDNPSNKHITTWFRKVFSIADTTSLGQLTGSVLYDDGAVIYFNGEEIYRGNMPEGTITSNTYAVEAIPVETTYYTFSIPKGKIKPGENTIAVEVHQNGPSSSDISFDLDLRTFRSGAITESTVTTAEYSDIANSDVAISAYFEPVSLQEGLVINEFSASNNTYQDEVGESDDWIEVYNNGSEPIDIAGFFITDNLNNKTKHRIQRGRDNETIIQPGEYRIIWADEQTFQGPLHVNFKLSADGEQIGIYQMTGASLHKVDEIVFAAQMTNTSYSRIPNITGPFLETSKVTPSEVNVFEVPTPVEASISSMIDVFPNPSESLVNVIVSRPVDFLRVYSMDGKLVESVGSFVGERTVLKGTVPKGLYMFIFSVDGQIVTRKVIRR